MSEPFFAEIRILPYTFAPLDWASCDGQIIQVTQNTALYSIIGNQYGGTVGQTFALPNLKGRVPMGIGSGPGLTPRSIAQTGGTETVQLIYSEMPSHIHAAMSERDPVETPSPVGAFFGLAPATYYWSDNLANLSPATPVFLATAGSGGAHENRQPYLALQFCICLNGDYPVRN